MSKYKPRPDEEPEDEDERSCGDDLPPWVTGSGFKEIFGDQPPHTFNVCSWCDELYPTSVPFYPVHSRLSAGHILDYVCAPCLDKAYDDGNALYAKYLKSVARRRKAAEAKKKSPTKKRTSPRSGTAQKPRKKKGTSG